MTTVSVTAGHIAKGKRDDCTRCPVVLAVRDAFPAASSVLVSGLHVYMQISRRELEHELPAGVQEFIHAYDTRQPVAPFTFDLDYPAEVAA